MPYDAVIADRMRQKGKSRVDIRYFRDLCTVLRRDVTQEGDGSHATDYKPLPVRLKCRLMTSEQGSEVEEGDKLISVMGFSVRFPVGSDIRDTDRLEIKNTVYAVVTTDRERTDALFLTATCTRVQ